jgi:hypothetical protein
MLDNTIEIQSNIRNEITRAETSNWTELLLVWQKMV